MFLPNKHDLAERLRDNPIISPGDVAPSSQQLEVIGTFNPAAFEYKGRIGLLIRVAERPRQKKARITVPRLDPPSRKLKFKHFKHTDPHLDATDPRMIVYRGRRYLTSISHFRLAWSDDGINFTVEPQPTIYPEGIYETFGIEDPRVTRIHGTYYITYSAVSEHEVSVGMITTTDWRKFKRQGPILQPVNKNACLLPRARQPYWLIHRPMGMLWGRYWMWISRSPDLIHWGRPRCLACTRPGKFDSARVGAGPPPILTEKGYLEIYHGADQHNRYCLAAILLDRSDPSKVLARSERAIMKPVTAYERTGFFGKVVFADGALLRNDHVWIYYAAADTVTCLARISLQKLWQSLGL